MNRELNAVFLAARSSIESVLSRHGFDLTREVFDHAAFASAQAEYRHRAHWLSLHWDGKDGYLWLSGAICPNQHTLPSREAWRRLDQPEATVRLEGLDAAAEDRISQLVSQAEAFLVTKAAG